MSLATLPATGESIGSGGFGEVFLDPTDDAHCIKKFTRPVKGPTVARLMRIVELPTRLRPSDRAFLTSRFAWPVELFGNEKKLVGHRMPLAPEEAVFDLIAAQRATRQLLQAMYVLDASYWDRAAIQSSQPYLSTDGRLLVMHDLLRALGLLHHNGFAYVDLSAKNVCIANGELPRVFLLDTDSVVPTDAVGEPDVRTADWEVDETPDLVQRDWVKAAMFAWRLLLQERLPRPDRSAVVDFDLRTGVALGEAIVWLHERADGAAAEELGAAIRAQLSVPTQDELIEAVQQEGFARDVVALRDLPRMPVALLAAAVEQVTLETRIETSTGLQRRLLTRGLRHQGDRQFRLDVLGGVQGSTAPRSAAELERLVLEARFEEVLDHFVDGGLADFSSHPWRERAVQHALVLEPEPVLDVTESEGVVSARFSWPESPLVDVARLRIWAGRDLMDERAIDRQARHPSVRIRGIGAGLPQGTAVGLQLTFGVRSDDGTTVLCPAATTVSVRAPVRPVRQQTRVVRSVRETAAGVAGRERESLVDVARPDPDAPARRRKQRLRRLAAGMTVVVVAAVSLLFLRDDPQAILDAAAVSTPEGVEVVWATRSAEDFPSDVDSSTVQRRILGLVWFRRSELSSDSDIPAGEVVRVMTDAQGPFRVTATLKNGDRIRSGRLDPIAVDAVTRGAPDRVEGLTQERREGGAVRIGWDDTDVGAGRIVERYQVVVLDTTGGRIAREETGGLGLTIPRTDVLRAPLGLDVRVRVIASDGSRSPWATIRTPSLGTSSIPRPTGVALADDPSGARVLRWRVDPVAQGVDVTRFEVSTVDVVAGEREVIEVEDARSISAAELFATEGSPTRVVRVRSVLQDGAVGPWSDALIIGREQIGSTR